MDQIALDEKLFEGVDPLVTSFMISSLTKASEYIMKGSDLPQQIMYLARAGEKGVGVFPLIGIYEMFKTPEKKELLRYVVKNAWAQISGEMPRVIELLAVIAVADWYVGRDQDDGQDVRQVLWVSAGMKDKDVIAMWEYIKAEGRGQTDVVFAPQPMVEMRDLEPEAGALNALWPL